MIAKFLSADPHITDPVNGQNYNRYSYVLNNPTNFTDPTGYNPISTIEIPVPTIEITAPWVENHTACRGGYEGCSETLRTLKEYFKAQKNANPPGPNRYRAHNNYQAANSGVSQAWGAVKDWAVDGWNHLKEGPSMNDLNGIPDLGPVLAGVGGLIKEAQVVGEAAQVQQVVIQGTKSVAPIAEGEVVSFSDFVRRSVVGDGLEAHELWQHANLKANGLATTRMGSAASKANPVIALSKDAHAEVSAAQRALDAAAQTPAQNIAANANILRNLNSAPESSISKIENWASDLAKSLGF